VPSAARLIPRGRRRGSRRVGEEREPLEASYLAALLPVSEANWRDDQELITKLVRSKNPLVTLRMADLLTKVSDRGLQSLPAEELVRPTGAKPRTGDPKDVARAVRAVLGAAGVSSAQSQEDRWELLRFEVGSSLTAKPLAAANHAELLQESAPADTHTTANSGEVATSANWRAVSRSRSTTSPVAAATSKRPNRAKRSSVSPPTGCSGGGAPRETNG